MENEVVEFLAKYIDLTEEEAATIIELDLIKKYPKGTTLLREGEVCQACYLVLEGCLRSYYLIDGEEKTTGFFVESQLVYTVSYMKGTPSEHYLSCLEDCIACVGSPEKTKELVKKIPKLESIGHLFNSELMVEKQVFIENYMTLGPEKRYLKLLESRPDLVNRVPQYYLASYLGIKPETLSRIRKRLVKNKV